MIASVSLISSACSTHLSKVCSFHLSGGRSAWSSPWAYPLYRSTKYNQGCMFSKWDRGSHISTKWTFSKHLDFPATCPEPKMIFGRDKAIALARILPVGGRILRCHFLQGQSALIFGGYRFVWAWGMKFLCGDDDEHFQSSKVFPWRIPSKKRFLVEAK